ncbi:hypothetical protein [Robertkochia solimangrovi]|uniref:hypothetical protein n=1 Tax=Robertkochia solimangrovi TaxID=2213046 RepID=UPI00117DFE36|nr:hypothetical protein [Robertkochia solimangrovi]
MKNILFKVLGLMFVLLVSCEKEDFLEPSNADTDRVAGQIDLSIPEIKKWYNEFNMGVLYEYHDTLDFAYAASTDDASRIWETVEIPMMRTIFEDTLGNMIPGNETLYEDYLLEAVKFYDTTLFKYFDPNGKIAEYMPYKVLISESIFSPSYVPGGAGTILTESEERYSSTSKNGLRVVYNPHSIVMTFNKDNVEGDIEGYTKDNFYIFLNRIISMHELYNEIPATFFSGKATYYGQDMEIIYREEMDIEEEKNVYVFEKDWFYEKGFVDAQYFYGSGLRNFYQFYDEDGNRLPSYIKHEKALVPGYEFVSDKFMDVRSYLNEMMFRDADELLEFPENIQENMKILIDYFEGMGVSILEMNPDLEVLN